MTKPPQNQSLEGAYLASPKLFDEFGPMTGRTVVIGSDAQLGSTRHRWIGLLSTVIKDDSTDAGLNRPVTVRLGQGGNPLTVPASQLRLATNASVMRQTLIGEFAISDVRIRDMQQITTQVLITNDTYRQAGSDLGQRMLTVRIGDQNISMPANRLLVLRMPTQLGGIVPAPRRYLGLDDLIRSVNKPTPNPRPFA